VDVEPLRQLKPAILEAKAHLFRPLDVQRWHPDPSRGRTNRRFVGQNPPNGVAIYYHLGQKAEKVSLKVFDIEGNAIRTLSALSDAGLQRVVWDLARAGTNRPQAQQRRGGQGAAGQGEAGERRPPSESGEEGEESPRAGERERDPDQPRAGGRGGQGCGGPGGGQGPGQGGFGGGAFGRPQAVAPGTYRIVL